MYYKLWSILFLLLCFNCKKVEIDKNLPQVSISSIISPSDSLISVFITKVIPVGETYSFDIPVIQTANVNISNGVTKKELIFNKESKTYTIENNFFIESGKEYKLTVTIAEKIYTANTLIPENISEIYCSANTYSDYATLICNWQDPSETENYYNLIAENGQAQNGVFFPISWENGSNVWETQDEILNGEKISSPIGYLNNISPNLLPLNVNVKLLNMDKVYYEYSKKIRKRTETGGFFSKLAAPIIFQSNFNNALGFFGSYTVISRKAVFK